MKKPNGYIVYRGPSQLNGEPVVAVAVTGHSDNTKTGNMVQVYILVDNDKSPLGSAYSLADVAICGDCKHRRGTGGACYVNLMHGPNTVMSGVRRNIYPHSMAGAMVACKGRMVRLGAYGDPAAVPAEIWETLVAWAKGTTGYTHQWKDPRHARLMKLVMASVDSETERREAAQYGYRTFRVLGMGEVPGDKEFYCPATTEGGGTKTCEQCGACDGGVGTRKANPVVLVHGPLRRRFEASRTTGKIIC